MALVVADNADDLFLDLTLGNAGAFFLDKIAAMELYYLEIVVVQIFQKGRELGIAVITNIKVGKTLCKEAAYLCKDNRLVLAVVFNEELCDRLLDLILAGDGFLDLINGGHLRFQRGV